MNLLIKRGAVQARVNWGRWIADCMYCPSAMQLPRGWPAFTCLDCGQNIEVLWPGADLADGIERLLLMRPNPANRNWEPGETLHDLLQENILHGDFLVGADGLQLAITDDRIMTDALPRSPFARRQLEGG